MKMFGTVFFICTCFFLLYILLASTPLERINRSCLPVSWTGTAVTSAGAIFSQGAEAGAQRSSRTLYDSCRFFVFRQFYAEELARLRAAQADGATAAPKGEGQ